MKKMKNNGVKHLSQEGEEERREDDQGFGSFFLI
jgi:hypothetical protein